MFDKREALEAVLDSLDPGVVQASRETIAAIQREFVGNPEGLINAMVGVSTIATLTVADIADAREDSIGPVQ